MADQPKGRLLAIAVGAALVLLIGIVIWRGLGAGDSQDPASVLEAFEEAQIDLDLGKMVDLVAEDAVFEVDVRYQGKAQIEPLLRSWVDQGITVSEAGPYEVSGDTVTFPSVLDYGEYFLSIDENRAVVREGLIVSYTSGPATRIDK